MPNIAFLVGNTEYQSLTRLDCCRADVAAMKELLDAAEKYETIEIIENADANDLKEKIRAAVGKANSPAELFFYYTGHGYSHEDEFFYCARNFDPSRPNETGLSTSDLHTFLRLADADLVIKVADACSSGTHLVKSEVGLTPQNKQGFKNLIQISSCLDTQSSLTGHPLSLFTQKFRNAALSKTEGVVYYTDVIAALRDQFIGNDTQIPFFVSQYTGREQFADDACKLDKLRDALKQRETGLAVASFIADSASPVSPPTLTEILYSAEARLATPELMDTFVATFFDSLKDRLEGIDVAEYFQFEFVEHDDFPELTAKRFIIEVLSREKRTDNFVTAEISRKHRRANPLLGSSMALAFSGFYDDQQYVEMYDLKLNRKTPRAQIRVSLTPKFSALQRVVLVVTCAPSLENCYVLEVATQHMLHDFGKYDANGTTVVQRWYKFDWTESTDGVVGKITDQLSTIVRAHIENTAKRLSGAS
jgi:hypothetical protein